MVGAAASETRREFMRRLAAAGDGEKSDLTARWVLAEFESYYTVSRAIPTEAQAAFEARDHGRTLSLSHQRLSIYSDYIHDLGPALVEADPELAADEAPWQVAEAAYLEHIGERYEADLAFAFFNSARRRVYQGEWKPVAYSFGTAAEDADGLSADIIETFDVGPRLRPALIREIFRIPGFSAPYLDEADDAELVTERIVRDLDLLGEGPPIAAIHMIKAGFFRNRGAYLMGRMERADGTARPLVIALLNDEGGIYVDAVLIREDHVHNIFNTTLANFHVTNSYYHELAKFLKDTLPSRPLGLQYSTIGFNHVGKVAVMNELRDHLSATGEVFATAPGFRGTVAIGFTSETSAYALKVIRDHPTEGYKWGEFEGLETVLAKYGRVHEINRTGSMLDNIIYYNLRLDRSWFEPALLDEIVAECSETVSLQDGGVVFKALIVQRKLVPLPVFLETASEDDAEEAIVNLGHCIKNNAAANIYNKDLDGRNYGVSRFRKVYLFDYDALEPFTEVKIRTNAGRFDGEEDVPDWVFEDGIVFLPEEIETGLRIPNRRLSRVFRNVHGDLMSVEYWEQVQRDLADGKVPGISIYPDACRLTREIDRLGAYY